jgi:ferric-dicitrate binding protein FerR (iron transport regulator)
MDETLGAIAAEFNRYNRTPHIEVAGVAAQSRDYSAMSFEADDPESLLAVLQADPGLEVLRQGDKVVVRQR